MDNVVGDGNSGGGGYGGMPHASVPTTGHPSVRPVNVIQVYDLQPE